MAADRETRRCYGVLDLAGADLGDVEHPGPPLRPGDVVALDGESGGVAVVVAVLAAPVASGLAAIVQVSRFGAVSS